ncbi:hypothetical protein [Glaciecola sp. 1036]|uniref:hypothetical protein n=1 Tax=Alteromonadaceae TaxID=72275 RepID=UPI003D055397
MKFFNTFALIAVVSVFSTSAQADNNLLSLKNLERERAKFLHTMLSDADSPDQKRQQILMSQRHLIDMERMVIRDDRLTKSQSDLVKSAFLQFDLTFLMHSSAEQSAQPLAHWMKQVGMDTQSVINAKPGFRK